MSTFLYKFYFRNSLRIPSYNKDGLVFFSDKDLAFFFEKLANILGFAGKKRKIFGIFRKVFFLIRLTFNVDVRSFFKKMLSDYIVFLGIKPVRKRTIIIKELYFLEYDKAFGLFCRWFKFALGLRSERNLSERVFKEFMEISLGTGLTLRKRQDHINKVSEIKKQLYL